MSKQPTSASSRSRPRNKTQDAITLLKGDHAKVKKMFAEFAKLNDSKLNGELARQICSELTVHSTIEEELFYPVARQVLSDGALLDEAEVEHASAKELISQIESSSPDSDKWEAKVTVLGEYVEHHVAEEHKDIFPKMQRSTADLKGLGKALIERKAQLTMG
jgi:hemerythrin superfamily protein